MITYEKLYPNQQKLFKEIEATWNVGNPAVVVAGQRSGKTILIEALTHKYPRAVQIGNRSASFTHISINAVMNGRADLTEYDLIIFDEAFWTSFAFTCFRKLLADRAEKFPDSKILFIGSKCDFMEHWDEYVTSRYSTKDLNDIDAYHVVKSNSEDAWLFERDFGCNQVNKETFIGSYRPY